jgi:hypothetical protein
MDAAVGRSKLRANSRQHVPLLSEDMRFHIVWMLPSKSSNCTWPKPCAALTRVAAFQQSQLIG